MTFQAYLDNIEEKTGKAPKEFVAEAKQKNLSEFKDIMAWLKGDYKLGTGHARALAHVIIHGPGTLNLEGKSKPRKRAAR